MKKILVPTDFSTCAGNALDYAVQSAKILPAEIILLHAFEEKGSLYTDYMGVNKEFNQSLLNDVELKLQQLKLSIEQTEAVIVTIMIFRGTVIEAISDNAVTENVDLIVMGTLGASGLKEVFVGSNTASVVGNTHIPVMAIPHNYAWQKPEKFLIATNQFEKDSATLDFVFNLAHSYMAQVQVAVFTDEDDDKAATFLEHTRRIPLYEKTLKEQYKEESLTASHLYGLEFEETLQKHIKENEIDILVMITYHMEYDFWDRIFKPSKTKRMSFHTDIPLLAIPAK